MKKNITINLCGRLFQIDEDAYELLQQYINSLRSSFGKQEGGDEIDRASRLLLSNMSRTSLLASANQKSLLARKRRRRKAKGIIGKSRLALQVRRYMKMYVNVLLEKNSIAIQKIRCWLVYFLV